MSTSHCSMNMDQSCQRHIVLWMWINHINVTLFYECGSIMSTSQFSMNVDQSCQRHILLWMWINHVNVTLFYECASIMSTSHRRWSLWCEMRWKDHFKQNISTIERVSRIWKRGKGNVIMTSHEKTVKFVIVFYVNMHGKSACWLVYKKIYIVLRQICLLPKVATLRAFTPPPFNCPRCLMDRMIASRTVDRGIDTWKCQTKIYWITNVVFYVSPLSTQL
jgi:hypothetical protein